MENKVDGKVTKSGNTYSLTDIDSGLAGCRIIPTKIALKASSVSNGCSIFLEKDKIYVWYETSGPIHRVLDMWSKAK